MVWSTPPEDLRSPANPAPGQSWIYIGGHPNDELAAFYQATFGVGVVEQVSWYNGSWNPASPSDQVKYQLIEGDDGEFVQHIIYTKASEGHNILHAVDVWTTGLNANVPNLGFNYAEAFVGPVYHDTYHFLTDVTGRIANKQPIGDYGEYQLTLQNGWTPRAVPNVDSGLFIVYLPNGMCFIHGQIVAPNPAPTPGQIIAFLPTFTNTHLKPFPKYSYQIPVQSTGPTNTDSIDIDQVNTIVTYGGYPGGLPANGILVVQGHFYVGNGHT